MKRQDVSGQNTLHTDGSGGAGTDVNIASVGGTPVTDPLPVSIASVPGDVTVVQPTGTNLHVVTDATSTTIATQATGTNLHVVTDATSTTIVTQATGTNLHAVLDSGTTTVTQATGTNLHTVIDSGSVTATVTGTVTANQGTSPWIVAGGGTAGTAATGVVSVQGIASMTPVQVSQATGTNLHAVIDSGTLTTVSTVTAVTAITNALPAGTNLLGKVSASDETSTIYSGTTALTPKFAAISASSNGNNTIIVAGTNKIRVLGWNLMASGTVNVKWQSGAGGTDLTGLYYLIANTGISVAYSPVGWFETASATLLNLNLSAGVAVGGNICYIDVA